MNSFVDVSNQTNALSSPALNSIYESIMSTINELNQQGAANHMVRAELSRFFDLITHGGFDLTLKDACLILDSFEPHLLHTDYLAQHGVGTLLRTTKYADDETLERVSQLQLMAARLVEGCVTSAKSYFPDSFHEFYANHFSFMSKECHRLTLKYSSMYSRSAIGSTRDGDWCNFGLSDNAYSAPINHILLQVVKVVLTRDPEELTAENCARGGPLEEGLDSLVSYLDVLKQANAKTAMPFIDCLFSTRLMLLLAKVAEAEQNPERKRLVEQGICDLANLVSHDQKALLLCQNVFRMAQGGSANWKADGEQPRLHRDLGEVLAELSSVKVGAEAAKAISGIKLEILQHAASAQQVLKKGADFDNQSFIQELAALCLAELKNPKPLPLVGKDARLVVTQAVRDEPVQLNLLKSYSSTRVPVMMDSLGL